MNRSVQAAFTLIEFNDRRLGEVTVIAQGFGDTDSGSNSIQPVPTQASGCATRHVQETVVRDWKCSPVATNMILSDDLLSSCRS